MQIMAITDAVVSLVSILLGVGSGYVIGALKDAGRFERIGLGIVISLVGGFLVSMLFGMYVVMHMPPIPLQIAAFALGTTAGGIWNWQTPLDKTSPDHIIFEPDDDEEFDRKIEEAFEKKG